MTTFQKIWEIAEQHGEDVALFALESVNTMRRLSAEFGPEIACKALHCIAAQRAQEDIERYAERAERELDAATHGLSAERSDHLLSLMFPT